MKYIAPLAVAVIALLQSVKADFEIYRVGIGGAGDGNAEGWQIYSSEANCNNAQDWIWRDSDDVSGGKYGLRCADDGDGCGRSADASGAYIAELEMNFDSDDYHWTYYRDREGALVDLEGNVIGTCYDFPGPELNCGLTAGRVQGYRKLRCEADYTADDINGNGPDKRSMRRIKF